MLINFKNILKNRLPIIYKKVIQTKFYKNLSYRKNYSKFYVDVIYSENIIKYLNDFFTDEKSMETLRMIYKNRVNKRFLDGYIKHDKPQYFCFEEMGSNFSDNEIVVDGGAYDGDTFRDYIEKVNKDFLEYHMFEPDRSNYKKLVERNSGFKKTYFYQMGLYSSNSKVNFIDGLEQGSLIDANSQGKVKVVKIDEFLNNKKITFIKLDIEGSEIEAIKGARNTIEKFKPKLAICVYHKPEDLFQIPKLIIQINPDYKFFLRHHSTNYSETVLYAY